MAITNIGRQRGMACMIRKTKIQEEFRQKLGLIVDFARAGSTPVEDFFNNPELATEITGIDLQLIFRLKIVLETISSGFKVDTGKFGLYTMDTARLYVELYPWYPMTPTMHKILMHASVVIQNAMLPIGQLSEEASQTRNKHFRHR